jgi:hypothetical protein
MNTALLSVISTASHRADGSRWSWMRRLHSSSYSVILPLQKYVKWDFGRDDVETPTEGPLIVDGSMFCSLNPNKLLASIIGEVKAPSLRDMSLSGFSPVEATLEVIIDGKIPGVKNTSGYGETLMALRHGRELMKLPTPSEKVAGANI